MDVGQIECFAKLVNDAGGDFRLGTYPVGGHDAWTKAWREDALWDWMFSKSRKGTSRRPAKKGGAAEPVPISLVSAVCSSSVPGRDAAHGPERVVDGLSSTWYESKTPFYNDDWWLVDFRTPIRGRFTLDSGVSGGTRAKGLFVESSPDGRKWTRVGVFSEKTGSCSFVLRAGTRCLRVRTMASRPQPVCLRGLKVFKDGE